VAELIAHLQELVQSIVGDLSGVSRRRVLASDPSREARWNELEPQLQARFEPGVYTIPMRADLLRPWTN